MSGALHLALDRARAVAIGPAGLAVLAWLVLAVVALPSVEQIAFAAGPRAVADLGLLGLRVALGLCAIVVGAGAVGPVLRAGTADLWFVRGLSVEAWVLARLVGGLVPLVLGLWVGVVGWLGIAALLGVPTPATLPGWGLLATVEVVTIACLLTFTGTLLRGAVGPVVGVAWLGVGRFAALSAGTDGPAAWVGAVLTRLAPSGELLDGQALLLGAAPDHPVLAAVVHGLAWSLFAVTATMVLARRRGA